MREAEEYILEAYKKRRKVVRDKDSNSGRDPRRGKEDYEAQRATNKTSVFSATQLLNNRASVEVFVAVARISQRSSTAWYQLFPKLKVRLRHLFGEEGDRPHM
jgi:hypothetical protein